MRCLRIKISLKIYRCDIYYWFSALIYNSKKEVIKVVVDPPTPLYIC